MTIQIYAPDVQVLTAAATVQGAAVPGLTKRVIVSASVCNTTAGVLALSAHLVPSGGAVAAGNCLISARPLAAGETYLCPELINQAVGPGGTVQALGNGLTFKYTAKDIVNG